MGWVQNFKDCSGLGYIFIFCFENDGYKFYNYRTLVFLLRDLLHDLDLSGRLFNNALL